MTSGITRPLDLALAWAESGSAPADARVLAEEVRAMHVFVKALETQREERTQALERLRNSVLRALRAEGADPVEAASFVREVADKLAARVAQLEPFLAVVPCPNPTEHEGQNR